MVGEQSKRRLIQAGTPLVGGLELQTALRWEGRTSGWELSVVLSDVNAWLLKPRGPTHLPLEPVEGSLAKEPEIALISQLRGKVREPVSLPHPPEHVFALANLKLSFFPSQCHLPSRAQKTLTHLMPPTFSAASLPEPVSPPTPSPEPPRILMGKLEVSLA